MDFELTPAERALRERASTFAREELNPLFPLDGTEASFRDAWRRTASLGIPGLVIPSDAGGAGRSPLEAALVIEGLGHGSEDLGFVFSLAAHLLACATPIWRFGTDDQRSRHLGPLCSGREIGAFAATEPAGGSDLGSIGTSARREGGAFRVDGTKTFITNAPFADLFVLITSTDPARGSLGGLTAFIVERDRPGLSVRPLPEMLGHRSTPLGEIAIENLRLPDAAVLGPIGGGTQVFQEAMNWERTLLFAAHVGLMERVLDESVGTARSRKLAGTPLGKHQALSHRLADAKAALEAARLLVLRAATRLGRSRSVALDASMAKLFVSETLLEIAQAAIRVDGARGYVAESRAARALRDAVGATLYSGTSEIQREFIARWMGL